MKKRLRPKTKSSNTPRLESSSGEPAKGSVSGGLTPAAGTIALENSQRLAAAGKVDEAKKALAPVLHKAEPALAARAFWQLGVLLFEQRDRSAAREAFQTAISFNDPDASPRALNSLGAVLNAEGDKEAAKKAFQDAARSGHPDVEPKAVRNLGVMLLREGDLEGAEEAFRRVISSGHPEQRPKAEVNFGELLEQRGDRNGAREAYERVIAVATDHLITDKAIAKSGVTALLNLNDEGALIRLASTEEASVRQLIAQNTSAGSSETGLRVLLRLLGDREGTVRDEAIRAFARINFHQLEPSDQVRDLVSQATHSIAELVSAGETNARGAAAAMLNLTTLTGAGRPRLALEALRSLDKEALESVRAQLWQIFNPLERLEVTIATKRSTQSGSDAIRDQLSDTEIYALGHTAGQVSGGIGTESDVLHFSIDDNGKEKVMLPVFTRPEIVRDALLRNPEWQTLNVLLMSGKSVLEAKDKEVSVVIDPWSELEVTLPAP